MNVSLLPSTEPPFARLVKTESVEKTAPDDAVPGEIVAGDVIASETAWLASEKLTERGAKALFKQSGVGATDDREQAEKSAKLAEIKRKIANGRVRVGRGAVRELLANGISLDKISFAMLSDIMTEINVAPDAETANARVDDVMSRVKALGGLNGDSIASLAASGRPVTLNNAFVAANISRLTDNLVSPGVPLPEIQRVFANENVAPTDENISAARLLLSKDAPVNAENVKNAALLLRAAASPGDERAMRNVRETVKEMVTRNADPNTALLSELFDAPQGVPKTAEQFLAVYERVIGALDRVKPEKVDFLAARQIPLTIANLLSADTENIENIKNPRISPENETAHRQLYGIQAKMTMDAVTRLVSDARFSGGNILSAPLSDVLRLLAESEKAFYEKSLKIARAEPNAENTAKMTSLFERLAFLNPLAVGVYADIIKNDAPFTIEAVYARADVYAALATSPTSGDHTENGMFVGLLENIGVEPGERNIRAAKILSQTEIDVTAENIARVKAMDDKIEFLSEKLLPPIAARMIKDGINPSKARIDELIEYIEAFDQQYGKNARDKIALMIAELDSHKTFSSEDHETLMGAYRALDAALKNDGAAMGVLLKDGGSRTLGGIWEAAKYFERVKNGKNGVSVDVYDDTVKIARGGRDDHILSTRFAENARPRALLKLVGEFSDDELYDAAEKPRGMGGDDFAEREQYQLELLEEAFNTPAETLYRIGQMGLPVTPAYIRAMNMTRKNHSFLSDALNELDMGDISVLEDPKETLENIKERADALADEETSTRKIDLLRMVGRAAEIQNALNERNKNGFVIPVRLSGGSFTPLRVYFFNQTPSGQTLRVAAALKTKKLGAVNAFAAIKDGETDITLSAESDTALNALKRNTAFLEMVMSEAGFVITDLRFEKRRGDDVFEKYGFETFNT
jgi:hypothetical protein